MKWATPIIPALALVCLLFSACALFPKQESLPAFHPEKLPTGRPVCSECHEGDVKAVLKPYASFNHTTGFVKEHRFAGSREERVCSLCHSASFCSDCHTTQTEIKPSLKLGNRPDRELQHRGDYLILHRIDGKVDPAGCFRCHGRGNNEQCRPCHRS